MIKPLFFTFGLALLSVHAVAATPAAVVHAVAPPSATQVAIDKNAAVVATIDEDRVMAERLKG